MLLKLDSTFVEITAEVVALIRNYSSRRPQRRTERGKNPVKVEPISRIAPSSRRCLRSKGDRTAMRGIESYAGDLRQYTALIQPVAPIINWEYIERTRTS